MFVMCLDQNLTSVFQMYLYQSKNFQLSSEISDQNEHLCIFVLIKKKNFTVAF